MYSSLTGILKMAEHMFHETGWVADKDMDVWLYQ